MQISEKEIQESLRLLSEQPIGMGLKAAVDQDINRLIMGKLSKQPEIRMEVVLALRQAVQENRYYVPEEQVASQLLGRCLADRVR
jgi:Anti-sigma-28 factor, FlgM